MRKRFNNVDKFLLDKFILYGLHVGGLKSFWNPKMKAYLLGHRSNFCVLNPSSTFINMKRGLKFILKVVLSRKKILFIGSPKGLERNFISLCGKYGHYYINNYDDGFFTNFKQKSDDKFLDITPSLICIFDLSRQEKVKKEIFDLNIPVLAFVNTDDNLRGVDYPIPANIQTWKGGIFVYNIFYHILSVNQKNIVK